MMNALANTVAELRDVATIIEDAKPMDYRYTKMTSYKDPRRHRLAKDYLHLKTLTTDNGLIRIL